MATAQEILDLAVSEGVELGVRSGRITARGTSEELGLLLVGHEKELVEALGGKFRSPWQDLFSERKQA